jgi:hypothetical protein
MRERTGSAIRASRTDALDLPRYRRSLMILLLAAILMTITGAFGTGAAPLVQRLPYWLAVMGAALLLGIGASAGIRAWGALANRPLIEGGVISLLIALPLTLTVNGLSHLFLGGGLTTVADQAVLFGSVLVVTAPILAIVRALGNAADGETVDQAAAEIAASPAPAPCPDNLTDYGNASALHDRLPAHLRAAELYAVEAEDHYLRVHTSSGSTLILLRFGDALNEVGPIEGVRTHRSWWVARSAVQAIQRMDGRAEITLPDGTVAPVSKSNLPILRKLGWVD